MEKKKDQVLSKTEIFQALSDAEKEYEELLKINEVIADTESKTFQEYYYRDINYPLSIAFKE